MDVEKYYPNILSAQSAKIIKRMWEESDLIIEGIDLDKLVRYLGIFLTKEEIVDEAFEELLYTKVVKEKTKKKKMTKKIGRKFVKKQKKTKTQDKSKDVDTLDNSKSRGADTPNTFTVKKKQKTKTEWKKPLRHPTEIEERKLFGRALELLIVTCMDNHVYQFANTVRIQNKGGPIGLKLTGEIADCLMIDWDRKLLEELKSHNIIPEVYTRFKDDIELVVESLEKGSRYMEGKVIIDEMEKSVDENKTDSKITMNVIQQIANNINPMIKLTVETPCNFASGKMPVLDVEVNINQAEENRIDFEFFEKPTKNPKVILATSALSMSKKRTILTQEGLRRLRNTKIELGTEVQKKHLNKYMLKLKNSGYRKKFRTEVLDSIMKGFEKIKENDKMGIRPIYRSRDWNKEERQLSKFNKKFNWWNTEKNEIQYKSVLFVTPTPGGVLAKSVQKREEELNRNNPERVKVVEKGGLKVKDIIAPKNPFKKSRCEHKKCPLCKNSEFISVNPEDVKIACNTNNVGYRWICLTCKERNVIKAYEGETGRSARTRGLEHLDDFEKKKLNSVLYKHQVSDHKNESVKFRMEISSKFKDALTRQANEAVRISNRPDHQLLNSKAEFNHPPLARVVIARRKNFKNPKVT